jgi:SAM-dependent methyltransferase
VSQVPLYDALAVDYDRFVNWEGRLSHELPFFASLFERHGVRRVLDAACGTGHHAIALARQGYQVVGTDLSAPMIARAGDNASAHGVEVKNPGHGPGVLPRKKPVGAAAPKPPQAVEEWLFPVTFAVAGLGGYAALGQTHDAAICLGNSLPHLLSEPAVEGALADFAAVLRPGGLLVIQNRNFDRVWTERERFMSPQSFRDAEGEWIFVRFYDFHEASLTFNMLRLQRTTEGWSQDVESTELRPIFAQDLASALATAGFEPVTLYGGYDGSPFDPVDSGDLIAVAVKTA